MSRIVSYTTHRPPLGTSPVVDVDDITRAYGDDADARVLAVDHVSLQVRRGEFVAIMGPSGSGKSTLLHCAAGLDRPTTGTVRLAGSDLGALDDDACTRLRREHVGFVFQSFNLIPTITAYANVVLPLTLGGRRADRPHVTRLCAAVGIDHRLDHFPSQLSGGQQQRVAIARALVDEPAVVFADEPTGNLDSRAARDVLRLLRSVSDVHRRAVVMVTHDATAADYADRVVVMRDGRVAETRERETSPADRPESA